jgi:hypothetical protein
MIPEVVGIDRYYMLRDQSLPKPVVPTTNPPEESAWVKTEPEYVEGSTNNLYTVDNVLYSDDTFQYSQVSLASSYTAAKQAYILAKENEKHFFFDTDGAHITHGEHTPNHGKNVLITNEGMAIRQDTDVLAEFSADKVQVGEDSEGHVEIKPGSTTFYGYDGTEAAKIANLQTYSETGDAIYSLEDAVVGYSAFISKYSNFSKTGSFSIPNGMKLEKFYVSLGVYNYGGSESIEKDLEFTQTESKSTSGFPLTVSIDYENHTYSVSIGTLNTSIIPTSWTETIAISILIEYTYTAFTSSYSFGKGCVSDDENSFVAGEGLISAGWDSFAIGKFNKADEAMPFMIGNGSDNSHRSNSLEFRGYRLDLPSADYYGKEGILAYFSQVFTGGKTSLGSSINLNNFDDPGLYFCASGSVAATQTNQPFSDSSYMMGVYKLANNSSKQLIQLAWQNKINSFIKFRIRTDTGAWGDWYSLARGSGDLSSYLTTTAAANTYARKDTVGTIVYKSLSADKSIAAGSSQKNMASISCAAGIWSVTAHAAFQPGGTVGHYRAVSIGSSATNATYGTFQCGSSNGSTVIQTSRHITLTSTTTLYLNVYSQDAITVNAGGTIIEAVRLR